MRPPTEVGSVGANDDTNALWRAKRGRRTLIAGSEVALGGDAGVTPGHTFTTTLLERGTTMKKFFITAGALVALAAPSVALASQPTNPGGFGQERAANIQTSFTNAGLGNWGQWTDGAAARAGDNGTQNNAWKAAHGYLPVESSLTTP